MMSREITTVERLRKFVPIIPIVAVVVLFVCFFLPKSAVSIMQVNAQKVHECCINKADVSGAGTNLSIEEQDEFLDLLSKVRLNKAIDTNGNGFPVIDYIITVTKSSGAVVSAGISTEGYFFLNDGEIYRMQKGSYEELSTFLQGLPYGE